MLNFIKRTNVMITKDESYKYVANNLLSLPSSTDKKIFILTSSSMNLDSLKNVVKNLGEKISKKKFKTLIIELYFNNDEKSLLPENKVKCEYLTILKFLNISAEKFRSLLEENSEIYDVILVCLPCVMLKADALECAKVYKKAVLVEKYGQCYYLDFENTLLSLKISNIEIQGVITVE